MWRWLGGGGVLPPGVPAPPPPPPPCAAQASPPPGKRLPFPGTAGKIDAAVRAERDALCKEQQAVCFFAARLECVRQPARTIHYPVTGHIWRRCPHRITDNP